MGNALIAGERRARPVQRRGGVGCDLVFPTAVDRFIAMWEMAGEVLTDPIIKEGTDALKRGGGAVADPHDAEAITPANALLTLHELIAHRLVPILWGVHRGRVYSM